VIDQLSPNVIPIKGLNPQTVLVFAAGAHAA
jgi:hypothetical protein